MSLSLYREILNAPMKTTFILSSNVIASKDDDGLFAVGYKAKPRVNDSFYMECPNEESVWIKGNSDRDVVSDKISLYRTFKEACESVGSWFHAFMDVEHAQIYITVFESKQGVRLVPVAEVYMIEFDNNKVIATFLIQEGFKESLKMDDFSIEFYFGS